MIMRTQYKNIFIISVHVFVPNKDYSVNKTLCDLYIKLQFENTFK